jgi:hypothetical protein
VTATIASSAAILKTKYTQPKVYWESYQDNPSFADIRKDTTFDGNNKVIAIQTEHPTGGGSSIGIAQANLGPGLYKNFLITRIEDFYVARIKGQALRAAEKSTGALLDLWTREMDGAILGNTRSAAINMWRTGTGSRGQISSSSTVASATITLATVADVTNFYVGMIVQASQTDGGTLRNAGATTTITKINRVTGQLTVSGNWNAVITNLATSDFLYRNGDSPNGGTNLMVTGVQAYIPTSANRPVSSTQLFGLDRSVDDTRLAGAYLDGTNTQMQEAVLEATEIVNVEMGPGAVNRIWMHPRDRAQFVKELGAKVSYYKTPVRIPGSTASVGFKAIEMTLGDSDVLIMADINVPRFTCLVTMWETWCFESLGPAPQILNWDSNDFLRVTNDDSYEVRTGYYGQVSNAAPAGSCLISNFGQ